MLTLLGNPNTLFGNYMILLVYSPDLRVSKSLFLLIIKKKSENHDKYFMEYFHVSILHIT